METLIETKPEVAPVIEIPATHKERVLAWMIDQVKEGCWCQRSMRVKGQQGEMRRCALGMIDDAQVD